MILKNTVGEQSVLVEMEMDNFWVSENKKNCDLSDENVVECHNYLAQKFKATLMVYDV